MKPRLVHFGNVPKAAIDAIDEAADRSRKDRAFIIEWCMRACIKATKPECMFWVIDTPGKKASYAPIDFSPVTDPEVYRGVTLHISQDGYETLFYLMARWNCSRSGVLARIAQVARCYAKAEGRLALGRVDDNGQLVGLLMYFG